MIRSLALFALKLTLVGATVPAWANFSVKSWGDSFQQSLVSGNQKALESSLQFSNLIGKVSKRQATTARKNLQRARELYAEGKYESAIQTYNKVPKGTDEWLEAVEEKGWAYLRLGKTDQALAQTKTLTSPTFRSIVGSEPFFLQSLTQMKVCDYISVLETHKLFKESQRERMEALQNMADSGLSAELKTLTETVDRFPMKLSDLGENSKKLPRLFHRDRQAQNALLKIRLAETAIPLLRQQVEVSSAFRSLNSRRLAQLQKISTEARQDLSRRAKILAARETEENFELLQKINLIEIETIQRLHIDQSLDPSLYSKGEFKKADRDQLVFADDGHPWIDELDKFQVRLNACPKQVRRRM